MQQRKDKIKYISSNRGLVHSLRASFDKYDSVTRSTVRGPSITSIPTRNVSIIRMVLIALFFISCFAALTHHIYVLQVVKHDYYEQCAARRVRTSNPTIGYRGRIMDANGELLAVNFTTQSIYVEPKRINPEDRDDIANFLARELRMDANEISKKFQRVIDAPVEARIACELSPENAEIISCWKLPAVEIRQPLAKDSCHELVIYPKSSTEEELTKTIEQLSPFVGLSMKELKRQISKAVNRPKEIVIKSDVEFTAQLKRDMIAFREELKNKHHKPTPFPVRLVEGCNRSYPQGEMLANLIGFLDGNKKGYSGIEKMFDIELTPRPGHVTYQRDSRGNRLMFEDSQTVPARNGVDVYLTIQAPIQRIAEEELAKAVDQYNPERAYAIMMNPSTGAILALAQYPSFNLNDRSTFSDPTGIQNHCITEIFEPGSIMKSIPVSYALDKGIVSLDSKYFCENGRWSYGGRILRDTHNNQNLTVQDIITVSSNIGTAKVAMDMGQENLYKAFKAFGFGEKTHIGFIPEGGPDISFSLETPGALKALERWDYLSITRYPIGQGIACSPIQLLQAYGAIANNGTMMQPYIIDKIVDGDVVKASVPRVKGQPLTPAGAQKITQALISVVNTKEGTGKRAAMKDFTVAGKTGTGQLWTPAHDGVKGHYEEKLFTSSFVGFVPAEAPEIVMIVSTKRVKAHGGTICGPVFKNIAERTFDYLQISPSVQQQTTATTLNSAK